VALADDGLAIEGHVSVRNRELLYRNIKRVYWKKQKRSDGFYLSTQAFTDPQYRISVYRAALCGNDPSHAQEEDEDYVRGLYAEDVRAIDTVIKFDNNEPREHYRVDVAPAPRCDDPSHAEIFTDPEITSGGVFKRLQARLVCISRWEKGYSPSDAEGE
jgi:hypothetical protein